MVLKLFCAIVLLAPSVWKVWHDRNGTHHPNHDWEVVLILCTVASAFTAIIQNDYISRFYRAMILAGATYAFVFPYVIAYVLKQRGISSAVWYNHLSATAWPDKELWWSSLHWSVRMLISAVGFIAALFIYV